LNFNLEQIPQRLITPAKKDANDKSMSLLLSDISAVDDKDQSDIGDVEEEKNPIIT
jgi:hypothetical protein